MYESQISGAVMPVGIGALCALFGGLLFRGYKRG